jgi:hypothetical protein
MTHYEEITQEQEYSLIEIRTLGMSLPQARESILKDPSFQYESPLQYVFGQLAEIQDCFQSNRQFDAQKRLNRLRIALTENFTLYKTFPETSPTL